MNDLNVSEINTIRHTLWNEKYWNLYGLNDKVCGLCKWHTNSCSCDKTVYDSRYKNISNEEINLYLQLDYVKKFYFNRSSNKLAGFIIDKKHLEDKLLEINKNIDKEKVMVSKITF